MLTFNLKKEWFEKIKLGEKTHEYREVKPYWINRFKNSFKITDRDIKAMLHSGKNQIILFAPHFVYFRFGYSGEKLLADALSIRIIDGLNTDLKIDKPVFDIEFKLIKE